VVTAHGLSLWGFEVLGRLIERPADCQTELGAALGLDKSKIVRILDELEHHGHARRTSGADDRRRRVLTATDHGREAWESARRELDEIERELFLRLPARERDVVRRGLEQLVDALSTPKDS
jgi:DNA-binding MarR family transcriptional regulator